MDNHRAASRQSAQTTKSTHYLLVLIRALFLGTLASSAFAQSPAKTRENPQQSYWQPNYLKSSYGSAKHIKFEAKGFFYLHEDDQRWWFVDPEGHAYLAFGINHVEPHRILQPYNRLYWANKFGIDVNASMNEFMPHIVKKMKEDLIAFGFNGLACHNGAVTRPIDFGKNKLPYTQKVEFIHTNHYQTHTKDDFPDVWSDEYRKHVEEVVKKEVTPLKDDPYLIGYFFTACPIYTDLEAAIRPNTIHGLWRPASPTWPTVIRNMNMSQPGKQQYMRFIQARYRDDIEAFNAAYQTAFSSFKDLERENWRPGVDETNEVEMEDNAQFLFLIVDMAYKTQTEAVRRVDSNHLIFGDKINGNADTRDEIIEIAGKYFDLIYYGLYGLADGHIELMDRWSELTDRPFFSADCGINTPSRQMPDPFGPHAPTQEIRAEWTYEALDRCFSRSDFVGWGQCGWLDQLHVGEASPGMQHGGLQDPFGNYHLPMLRMMSHFSSTMYHRYDK